MEAPIAQSNHDCVANACCWRTPEVTQEPFHCLDPAAVGQLFQGECLQVAVRQAQVANRSDINLVNYLGMYKSSCQCLWCRDRECKHQRQECNGGEPVSFRKYKSERYKVKEHWVHWIIAHLQLQPAVHAFAGHKNHCLQHWWGEGSPTVQDAFSQNWGMENVGVLWLNPPYSK